MFVLGALSVEIANSVEYKWHSIYSCGLAEPETIAAPIHSERQFRCYIPWQFYLANAKNKTAFFAFRLCVKNENKYISIM